MYPAIGVLTASLLIGGWFLVGAALTIKHKPRGPFTIAHGTRFVTDGFGKGLFWLKLNGVPKITPIDVIAFYTITNVKDTPSLLSDLIMEISGAGRQWYRLNVINQSAGAIWSADPRKPTARSSVVTFPAGYLLGKVSNHEFQPGEPIQGWLLCQIPPEYIPSPEFVQVRLTIRDTAGDEMVEELGDDPSHNSDVLYMEMEYRGEADPIGNYEIVPYRPKAD